MYEEEAAADSIYTIHRCGANMSKHDPVKIEKAIKQVLLEVKRNWTWKEDV